MMAQERFVFCGNLCWNLMVPHGVVRFHCGRKVERSKSPFLPISGICALDFVVSTDDSSAVLFGSRVYKRCRFLNQFV